MVKYYSFLQHELYIHKFDLFSMKSFVNFAFAVFMLLGSTTVSAEGVHLGYCDGNIYTDMVTGQNGQAEVSAAVKITGEMLSPYASCQITSLYIRILGIRPYCP